ncbi:hypothetical protein TURU_077972 [Turdus rufiventris]|nr:hypothetical protein TURU_077972 [Turdus rufiventris]
MIHELESQGVVSKTHSLFNSPIWPVRKSDGEWRLTVDYRALNEVTPLLSDAVPDSSDAGTPVRAGVQGSKVVCHH